ncbi:uncharacterized protein RSE6_01515 [Rhynchosporium secalis]|uniref:Uncharacterized protein n=1 Tax=Rhynchosporium secalis TaxID=38038 RepID=A0A1E1LXZ8_RHYSE|nr:uncharacterized protein RSE6_01515 [Rhynchosporium secalis]
MSPSAKPASALTKKRTASKSEGGLSDHPEENVSKSVKGSTPRTPSGSLSGTVQNLFYKDTSRVDVSAPEAIPGPLRNDQDTSSSTASGMDAGPENANHTRPADPREPIPSDAIGSFLGAEEVVSSNENPVGLTNSDTGTGMINGTTNGTKGADAAGNGDPVSSAPSGSQSSSTNPVVLAELKPMLEKVRAALGRTRRSFDTALRTVSSQLENIEAAVASQGLDPGKPKSSEQPLEMTAGPQLGVRRSSKDHKRLKLMLESYAHFPSTGCLAKNVQTGYMQITYGWVVENRKLLVQLLREVEKCEDGLKEFSTVEEGQHLAERLMRGGYKCDPNVKATLTFSPSPDPSESSEPDSDDVHSADEATTTESNSSGESGSDSHPQPSDSPDSSSESEQSSV